MMNPILVEIFQTKAVIAELEQHRHAIEEAERMKLIALNEEIAKREEAEESEIRKHELEEAARLEFEQKTERIKHIEAEEKEVAAKRVLDDLKSKEETDQYSVEEDKEEHLKHDIKEKVENDDKYLITDHVHLNPVNMNAFVDKLYALLMLMNSKKSIDFVVLECYLKMNIRVDESNE